VVSENITIAHLFFEALSLRQGGYAVLSATSAAKETGNLFISKQAWEDMNNVLADLVNYK